MTPEQFAYWLQGHAEMNGSPTAEQWKVIVDHLQTVFNKVTPAYSPLPKLTDIKYCQKIEPAIC